MRIKTGHLRLLCAVANAFVALAGCQHSGEATVEHKEEMTSTAQKEGEVSRQKLAQFQYLPVGDPTVIAILEDNRERCDQVHTIVRALAEVQARGGESLSVAAYHLAMANARLAWAKGDWRECTNAAANAAKQADDMITESRYAESDPYQLDLLNSIKMRTDARLLEHEAQLRESGEQRGAHPEIGMQKSAN